ncbi:ThuA domain-containing protein [Paenibacillus solisilvae]|uniref:ThuA domain-containing protein n=1 Tax=Paenibacillus solisilvae TaxID=2486751 RepID=A0ABW0VR98_9BACL
MLKVQIRDHAMFEWKPINVTIWNEFRVEKTNPEAGRVYPKGIHTALSDGLQPYGFRIQTATLDQPEHGLTAEVLDRTDVLIWWGHLAHEEVSDSIVNRIYEKVRQGMGLIVLHSGHYSKIFRKLMGTSCTLKWREDGKRERIWVVSPGHPIAEGIGSEYFVVQKEEMYGEFFDIPAPDELIFIGWFKGGEVFRSGCAYYRGMGKVFYFQPGHETFPTYYNKYVLHVIANAVKWAVPTTSGTEPYADNRHVEPLENTDC